MKLQTGDSAEIAGILTSNCWAGTIQGLASYYYGHLQPGRSVELNRCYYNTMVDNRKTDRVALIFATD